MQQRIKLWSKNAFLHKNDVQSVTTGDRRYI